MTVDLFAPGLDISRSRAIGVCGIYRVTSPTHKIYIGQSIDIGIRWRGYNDLGSAASVLLKQSLIEHGSASHAFEVVELVDCADDLRVRENEWIKAAFRASDAGLIATLNIKRGIEAERSFEFRRYLANTDEESLRRAAERKALAKELRRVRRECGLT